MTGEVALALWAAAFPATHLLLSHPFRAPLVRRLGRGGFMALYSAVALLCLWGMSEAYKSLSGAPHLFDPMPFWWPVSLVTWFAMVLFAGSLRGNPALPQPGAEKLAARPVSGVYAITRHPMMWGFALWGFSHMLINPTLPSWMVSTSIIFTALLGAAGQDVKKRKLMGEAWGDWQARTSYLPFGNGLALPDAFALVGGTLLFLLVTWAHGWLGAYPTGLWRLL